MKKLFLILLIISMLFISSCTVKETSKTDNGKISVVTTLFPLYDFVKEIAGDNADITLLTQPGVDSHSFEPKSTDMVKISECDVFVYTGKDMEIWAEKIISSIKSENAVICDSSENITLECADEHENEHAHNHSLDPHIWTSPKNAKIMVENILKALCHADEKNKETYKQNADIYIKELDTLDKEFEKFFSENKKTMVFSSRFPFYYFAKDYEISYKSAFESCSAETEPDIKSMTTLIDTVKKENIETIFYTELSDPKITEAVVEQTGAKAKLFHSCHNVTKDEFERKETYLSLMRNNLNALKGAEE